MSNLHRVGSAAGAALFSLLLAAGAEAVEVGKAASVVPASSYSRGQIQRTIVIGESLEQNDRIRTTSTGSIQVRFLDDTMLTIGPDSEVLLDKFLFEGKTARSLSVELTRGAMRFVSGTSPRSAYEIRTPVATIGVRGSAFDLGHEAARTFFNQLDGSSNVCQPACQLVQGGDAPMIVTITGFSTASAAEAANVQKKLDSAHYNLAMANSTDPSQPSGAAAGDGNKSDSSGGPGGGGGGYDGPPPCLTCVNPPLPSGGPNFAGNPTVLRVTGAGHPINVPNSLDVESASGLLTVGRSSVIWDTGTFNLRSFTVGITADPLTDPNKTTLTRGTAGITDVFIGTHNGLPGGLPIYYLGAWTAGSTLYSQPFNGAGAGLIPTNSAFHVLAWGYKGDLFPVPLFSNSPFGATVIFSLEAATRPTWSGPGFDGLSTTLPGTFTGNLSVALGSTTVHYGLQGLVTMPPQFGSPAPFAFETTGGLASPWLSGASGPRRGDQDRPIRASGIPVDTGGETASSFFCGGNCFANVEFHVIFEGKVGITYSIEKFNSGSDDPSINGLATFAAIPGSTNPNVPGTARVAFADPYFSAEFLFTGSAKGLIQSAVPANFLASVGFDVEGGSVAWTRGVGAGVQEFGSVPGIIAWERWTGVVEQAFFDTDGAVVGSADANIPINGGLHFVHGAPASNVPTWGTTVQYNLVGATSPTVADGGGLTPVAPGTLLPTSKMGVNFTTATPKIGLDFFVDIGGGIYNFFTTGKASNPSSSQISTVDNLFATNGRELDVYLTSGSGTGVPSCTGTAGDCKAAVSGFLSGFGALHIGLSYLFGDIGSELSPPPVTGVAAFGMDFPNSNQGAFAYSSPDGSNSSVQAGLISSSNIISNTTGDATTPTGLALNQLDLSIPDSIPVRGWHKIGAYPAQTVEQGVIPGILGWERWTNGTVHAHQSGGAGPDINLTGEQSIHLIHGVAATNIPTSGQYTYSLVSGAKTSPTFADGSAAGTLNTAQIGVLFGATPKIGVNLNVDIGGGNYTIGNANQITNTTANGFNAPTLFSSGRFSIAGIGTTVNTAGAACSGGTCLANVAGFLAGDQAKHLGIVYQFGNGTAAKTVSGAAALSRP